jgi:nicotinate phosphoribosyltransferase
MSSAPVEAEGNLVGLVPADGKPPTNSFVGPLLTDMYQLTMCYAYFKAGKHKDHSTFDMFFRKPPFGGEYAIFAGLEECLRFIQSYRFSEKEIAYLKKTMAIAPEDVGPFFDGYLAQLDCSEVKVYAVAEGTVVFPRIPLLRIEGPLGICQLLETTLLNLCNFATLVCTNAARHRLAAGHDKTLLEFGLRRAQGPDGAMSASRYSAIGGFDGTSNVMAGLQHGLAVKGTHAHALVSAFVGIEELPSRLIDGHDVVELALGFRKELGFGLSSLGELAAFISFAQAFPDNFLALVDTYETLSSGVPNFLCVALALHKMGRKPVGIRLDSGDLAYLSRETRKMFKAVDGKYGTDFAGTCKIVASNDINEGVLLSLNEQKHDIDVFGIGTNVSVGMFSFFSSLLLPS